MRDYLIVGLTGPTGAGKSSASRVFEHLGFSAVNADKIAHEVVSCGSSCASQLAAAFGQDIIVKGEIDRALLAKRAFSSKEKTCLLNDITHPAIIRETLLRCRRLIDGGRRCILLDAPLLFESGLDILCDETVCVLTPKEIRVSRLAERDGIDRAAIERRMAAQHDDDFYIKRCGYVLDGSKTLQQEADDIARIAAEIKRVYNDRFRRITTNGTEI